MEDQISRLAENIRQSQASLLTKAWQLRAARPDLIVSVAKPPQLSLSVCAVDGGLFAHRLHGHDIVVARAVAVNFVYADSSLKSFDYYPAKSVEPSMDIQSGLDEHEAAVFRSLIRLKHELLCAISAVERYSPQLILMDGSLWTVPSDRPAAESVLAPLHNEVIGLYKKLYSICGSKQLCGVIKDSRSRKLSKDLGLDCSDTVLCGHMLKARERTAEMPYFDEKQKEPEGFWERLRVFYLKPSDHDLPLRIEFMQSEMDAGQVASLIQALSSISENFAYPAILIEADMRAAMDSQEIERIQARLSALDMMPLRRNSRPFR